MKTFGLSTMKISFQDYFFPTLVSAPIMSSFRIFIGTKLKNIHDLWKNS
jgi:hypothetical protein